MRVAGSYDDWDSLPRISRQLQPSPEIKVWRGAKKAEEGHRGWRKLPRADSRIVRSFARLGLPVQSDLRTRGARGTEAPVIERVAADDRPARRDPASNERRLGAQGVNGDQKPSLVLQARTDREIAEAHHTASGTT